MKRISLIAIVSLLLALVLTLASCQNAGTVDRGYDPEQAVTAESVAANFIKFAAKGPSMFGSIGQILTQHGKPVDMDGGYIVFYKETKDYMNNLTEEYTIYNIAEDKVLTTIKNTYADEFGGKDEYGNQYRPAKTLSVSVDVVNDIVYFAATYTCNTRIADEIIDEEELKESYSISTYTDFYDISGNLFATSTTAKVGKFVGSNDRYNAIAFGKTVGIFKKSDSTLATTADGDAEKISLPDFSNEKYYYYLGVSKGQVDYGFENTRGAIEVYNHKGKLVLEYDLPYEEGVGRMVNVLDNGDILIQTMTETDSLEYDVAMYGKRFIISTYVVDVETATANKVDFDYVINGQVITRADYATWAEELGLEITDNIRNVGYGVKLNREDKTYETEESLIFFDSLLNVNFVYTGDLEYGASVFDEYTLLKDGYMLMDIDNGATSRAIFDKNGAFVCYVPDGAIVTFSRIVVGYTTSYDLTMKNPEELSTNWLSSYAAEPEFVCTMGDCVVYQGKTRDYVDGEPVLVDTVEIISVGGYKTSNRIENAVVARVYNDLIVIYDMEEGEYVVYDTDGNNIFCVFATKSDEAPTVTEYEKCYIISVKEGDESLVARVGKTTYTENKYNPDDYKDPDDYDPDGDDPDGDDPDGDDPDGYDPDGDDPDGDDPDGNDPEEGGDEA